VLPKDTFKALRRAIEKSQWEREVGIGKMEKWDELKQREKLKWSCIDTKPT
jgi:hypothetical protein